MLSTFDLHIIDKEYRKYREKYGDDKVILVKRSHLYKYFYVFLPCLIFSLVMILLVLLFFIVSDEIGKLYWYLKLLFTGACFLFFTAKLTTPILDYYMDFTIITPKEITQYDQQGFFARPITIVASDKVKSIVIRKNGFLQSLFDYGTLVFLPEGDILGKGNIEINFVQNPEKIKEDIREILLQL